MNNKVESFLLELEETIQPYLGCQEYGCLRKSDVWFDADHSHPHSRRNAGWILLYEDPEGSSCSSLGAWCVDGSRFEYDVLGHPENFTDDPQEIISYVKSEIENIPNWRKARLKIIAKKAHEYKYPLEQALEVIRQCIRENKPYAATEEELQLYEQFCREVHSE